MNSEIIRIPEIDSTLTAQQPQGTLAAAWQIARRAGDIILPFFRNDCSHRLKADHSPLTEADLASHGFLVEALAELAPGMPVVSEESFDPEAEQLLVNDYWLIDPLDGTKGFLKGKPEFTVNVALMHAHHAILGVVCAPALGLSYLGQAGQGAWRHRGAETEVLIRTRPANASRLTVVASQDHCGPGVKRMLGRLTAPEVTNIGSSLKFCLLAEGKADLYFRDLPTMEWDTAAAQCVLESAGGRVLDLSGEPLRYGKPGLRNSGFVALGDPGLGWRELID